MLNFLIENKILSVIQEEKSKSSKDFLPHSDPKETPYFQNLVLGEDRDILFYSTKNHQTVTNNQENKALL